MLIGRVDELQNGNIYGWAFNAEQPGEHLLIRVMRGPQVIASGVANMMRPDLPEAGVGDGDHAFQIPIPPNITSFQGLMIIAQSQKAGEIPLPIATNDERKFDEMFETFSARYEDVLLAFKEEVDAVKARCTALEAEQQASGMLPVELPADLSQRLSRLEARMEAAEIFFVRIDETVRKLMEGKGGKRKRFLGIF
jgi:hypothetical protein